jgi:protein arginine kinase
VYGERTKSIGHLYQVSNQGTLGASEETLIDKISQIVLQIVDKEKSTRELLKNKNIDVIEDEIFRSYGILTNARSITTDEAMKLLSMLKLGKEMNIIDRADGIDLYSLMVSVQPNNIMTHEKNQLSPKDRDRKRAELIRNELSKQF